MLRRQLHAGRGLAGNLVCASMQKGRHVRGQMRSLIAIMVTVVGEVRLLLAVGIRNCTANSAKRVG